MKKIILTTLFSICFICISHTSIDALEIEPKNFIIQDYDFGRYYTLHLKNTSEKPITIQLEEVLTTIHTDNADVMPTNTKIEQKFLEINKEEITINKDSEYNLEVRFKFAENTLINKFPTLSIKDKSTKEEILIPFIAQCNKCELNLENKIEKNRKEITFDKSLTITGHIQNTGGKFTHLKGDITIIKNGNTMKAISLNDQLSGILFPKNDKVYTYTYEHDSNILKSIGSYTVESRIYNDINEVVNGARITYIYIPIEFTILLGSMILLIILVTLVLKLRKKSVK